MKENNKGFTLIELLAILVILSIIMGIAIPAIFRTIEKSRKETFQQTAEGIARSASIENKSTPSGSEETAYRYKNSDWTNNYLEIDGKIPKYIEVKVKEDGNIRYAITDGRYCATKEYDGEITIKKIGEENNDKKFDEQYCVLDFAEGTSRDCFETKENSDGTLTITNYYKNEGNKTKNPSCPKELVIPNKIDGKNVTEIANQSFYNKGIKSVTIPNTVKKIGSEAFRNCQLTSLILPEGVEFLGTEAFADNKIQTLSLPSTLKTLSNHAFRNNKLPPENAYLYKINSDGVIDYSTIVGYAGESKAIKIPAEKNGVILTTIEASAFYNNGLTSVEIPNTVKNIGNAAFRKCQLTSLTLPEGVEILGGEAFADNEIKTLSLPSTLKTLSNHAFRNNKLPQETAYLYKRNSDGSIDYSTIVGYGGESKEIEIPGEKNGVKLTAIGASTFYNNGLTSVVIPNTVKNIGTAAFRNCNITELVIPESVSVIEGEAFLTNPLISVTIKNTSNSITIGRNSFGSFDTANIRWLPEV